MYFIDFFKNVFKKKNIGIIIWLILNTVMMCFALGSCIKEELPYDLEPAVRYIIAYASGLVIYFITVLIALSPVGEFFLRLQNGCKKIVREDHNERLLPLFQEVYQKAKSECPELSEDIQMFMSDDDEPNAFAVGRKTICITKGLLKYSDDEIKAVLSHEFGHIAHKDTDAILVVGVGNMIVTLLFVLFRVFVNVVARILNFMISFVSDSAGTFVAGTLTRLLVDFLLVLLMRLWTKLGVLLCLHSSRQSEFEADKFAHLLGYGDELCKFLDKTDNKEYNSKGLWAILNSTHPDDDLRIAELQKLGEISVEEKGNNVSNITRRKIKVKIANSNESDLNEEKIVFEKSKDENKANKQNILKIISRILIFLLLVFLSVALYVVVQYNDFNNEKVLNGLESISNENAYLIDTIEFLDNDTLQIDFLEDSILDSKSVNKLNCQLLIFESGAVIDIDRNCELDLANGYDYYPDDGYRFASNEEMEADGFEENSGYYNLCICDSLPNYPNFENKLKFDINENCKFDENRIYNFHIKIMIDDKIRNRSRVFNYDNYYRYNSGEFNMVNSNDLKPEDVYFAWENNRLHFAKYNSAILDKSAYYQISDETYDERD